MNEFMTDTGIFITDLYLLSYCGMKIIFQVCKTTPKTVFLIELATKRYRDGLTLTKTYKPSKNPLIIKENNVFSKSTYEVSATREDKKIPIRINMSSDIFWEAQKYVKYPRRGIFLAVPFENHRNTYWKKPKLLEREEDILA